MKNVFEPSQDNLIPPIYEFGKQINSLYRYWKFSQQQIEKQVEEIKAKPDQLIGEFKELVQRYEQEKKNGVKHDKETAFIYENDWTDEELTMDFEENEGYDITLFQDFLTHSISASLSKLFFTMIDDVTEMILSKTDVYCIIDQKKFWSPKRSFEEELWKFSGRIGANQNFKIAQRIEAFSQIEMYLEFEIDELTDNLRNFKGSDLDFLENYFQGIAEFTGRIELRCINYFQNNKS